MKQLCRDSWATLRRHPVLLLPLFLVHIFLFAIGALNTYFYPRIQTYASGTTTHAVQLGVGRHPRTNPKETLIFTSLTLLIACAGLLAQVIATLITSQRAAECLSTEYQLARAEKVPLTHLAGSIVRLSLLYGFVVGICFMIALIPMVVIGALLHLHGSGLTSPLVFTIGFGIAGVAVSFLVTPEMMRLIARATHGVVDSTRIALGRKTNLVLVLAYVPIVFLSFHFAHTFPTLSFGREITGSAINLSQVPLTAILCIAFARLTFIYPNADHPPLSATP